MRRQNLTILWSYAHVGHTTAKQVFSRRRKNENVFKMSKDERCTCKACKNTVFYCQICPRVQTSKYPRVFEICLVVTFLCSYPRITKSWSSEASELLAPQKKRNKRKPWWGLIVIWRQKLQWHRDAVTPIELMSTALVSEVILDGLEILKLLLFGSEILDSCHSSRLSWISKIQYQIKFGSKRFDKSQMFTVGR